MFLVHLKRLVFIRSQKDVDSLAWSGLVLNPESLMSETVKGLRPLKKNSKLLSNFDLVM